MNPIPLLCAAAATVLDITTNSSRECRNNSYEATFGNDGWGFKAQQKLSQVKGKDFTREKNKKKRSNYRGGAIDLGSNSIKFDSDGE